MKSSINYLTCMCARGRGPLSVVSAWAVFNLCIMFVWGGQRQKRMHASLWSVPAAGKWCAM